MTQGFSQSQLDTLAATAAFDRLEDASQAVAVLIGSGLEPAAPELLPPGLIRLMNREKALGLPEAPTLFCEFHGIDSRMLSSLCSAPEELCRECGAVAFSAGTTEAQRQELWCARHEAWETIHRAHPGKDTLIVDAAVPMSAYPDMVVFAQGRVDETGAVGCVFGHAGDGNLHVVMAGDPENESEWRVLEDLNARIVSQAVELGGTCTGEHGVGIGKRRFMQQIKALIDPQGAHEPGEDLSTRRIASSG